MRLSQAIYPRIFDRQRLTNILQWIPREGLIVMLEEGLFIGAKGIGKKKVMQLVRLFWECFEIEVSAKRVLLEGVDGSFWRFDPCFPEQLAGCHDT